MFTLRWMEEGAANYDALRVAAETALKNRKAKGGKKSNKTSKPEGLFKQVCKALQYLRVNPKHPSLNTHEYDSLPHPWDDREKVWEAYAQNNTPGAYRIFWCYGPGKKEITVIAITPHP